MNPYPPAPWHMHGSLWLSVFRLGRDVDAHHPAGTYGVALVSYEEPSPLTYHELLLARTVKNAAGKGALGSAQPTMKRSGCMARSTARPKMSVST